MDHYQQQHRFDEIYEEFRRLQKERKTRLQRFMAAVLAWTLIFFNFVVAPKSEEDLSVANYRINQIYFFQHLHVLFFSIFVPFIVYKLESDVQQSCNYLWLFSLFTGIMLPVYPFAKDLYITLWFISLGCYIMYALWTNSLPFVFYPDRWPEYRQRIMANNNNTKPT